MPANAKDPTPVVSLSDLQPLAQRLNSTSDDLNSALKDIEAQLVALKIGLEVYVDLRPEQAWFLEDDDAANMDRKPGASWSQEQLGLARQHTGEWKLVIRTRHFVEHNKQRAEGPSQTTLLLQASREDRLAAVAKVPELLAAISKKASAAIERIDRARELAKDLSETASF